MKLRMFFEFVFLQDQSIESLRFFSAKKIGLNSKQLFYKHSFTILD